MSKARVTLHDVAAKAGVSHQTVSRVINNNERVSAKTRAKVEAAIAELGYRPNVIARSMVWGKTRTLGCVTPSLTNYVFSRIIESAQIEARRQGFFVLTGSAEAIGEVQPLLDELLNRRVDGLMIMNPRDDARYTLLKPLFEKGIPIVYIKNTPAEEPVSSVVCDDRQGGYLATRHLIDLGHREIATVLGPGNEECTADRLAGYLDALKEAGISSPDAKLQIKGDWTAQSGIEAVEKLFAAGHKFSAVFAQNDRMAFGVIRGLRAAGYYVPDDYSVVGYDNIPLAAVFNPPLTTIHQPLDEFGEQAAKMVIEAINNPEAQVNHISFLPKLIERNSCAPISGEKGGGS